MSSPIIFEKGTRDFSTLGLGLLSDAIQATTTEELNGQFIFEMGYPVSGNNADLIKENRIIVVNSGHILKRQGFIIRQIVRKIDLTMTVYAEHVSYATLDVALAPIGTISGDAKTALENWKRMLVPAVDFTVDSDILTTNSTSIGAPEFETSRQGLGGHAGSILDVWGGEYQFDNWHIRLLKQRGKSANAIIAYGRNLISFEQETNIADTYTSVYPYYQENSGDDGNKTHFLPERTVDSEFVGKYPNPKVLMLDLSNKFKDVADYSETKLRNYALSYIQSNNIGVPKVNMKISTVDLSRATGGFSEDIDLGDTVNVYFEKLGITTSAKVIKAVWNVLSDDYDKFEIGARRASLTESISELATTADENANKALNQALVALQSADGKSTIYYLNSSDPWPTNPNENDTAFVKDGENSIMYRYMFNNDTGMFSWVKILDSMSADQIKQRVSDALESGKAYSDQLVADNVAQVNAVLDDVQAKQADLSAQQAELDTKAQGYADKALADAKADTLATATQTAKDAQEYTNTAKAEAISAATKADGVINQKIDDTASSITRTISQNKSDADGKISTAQSTATQALDGLTQKVSQNIYDAKVNELTGKISTAQQTADGVVTTIGNYKTSNDERVASAESKITANAEAITQKVSQTDYNQKTGELSGRISTISQTAGQISQSVSDVQTQVNNLKQINFVANSEFTPDFGGWTILGGAPTYNQISHNGSPVLELYANNTTNGDYFYSTPVNIANFQKNVAVSFDFKTVLLGNGGFLKVQIFFINKAGTVTGWQQVALIKDWYDWNTYVAKDFQLRPDNGTTDFQSVAISVYVVGISTKFFINKLMFVNSPIIGDYVPGEYNNNTKIASQQITIDAINDTVSNPSTGLAQRLLTAEGSLTRIDDPNTGLWAQQAQTAGSLKTEISDRKTGDSNTLTQAKDFTTSSINNSESGMRSLITQTSDSIIAKVDTKTDSATVLSLLKDNWSIGIADNAGAITNGIVGNSTNMSLISNNVVINAPSTQIKGTAWINSAMIGNGQIGNAQIGDAAITSAKIANLDVSKITGNVSNFIQSNWNGVYESTTITSNGMKIVTGDVNTEFGPYGVKLTQGGESVGGIGISSYKDMPANFQGISFRLDGTGDYMTWGARDSGVTTGDYTTKLSWFRSSYKPIGQNAGFNFSSDSPVTFWGDIYGRDNTEPLKIDAFGMKGVSAGGIGHGNGSSAITFGGDGETYIISSGTYYKLAQLVKSLQPLIGLGTWSAPKNINSSGVVTQWTNITT
ncbi:phage tail spike protein [Leuconostoc lactis]|uniref:phage tail spike protein n=1 Tax=Leuconostoc lactis TaxID=1246 RepID=UPI003B283E42